MTTPTRLVFDGGYTALDVAVASNFNVGQTTVYRVIVNVVSASAGAIIDSTGTTPTAANTILPIPASAPIGTIYTLNWKCFQGLSVVPGAGGALNVSYSVGDQG